MLANWVGTVRKDGFKVEVTMAPRATKATSVVIDANEGSDGRTSAPETAQGVHVEVERGERVEIVERVENITRPAMSGRVAEESPRCNMWERQWSRTTDHEVTLTRLLLSHWFFSRIEMNQ